MVGLIVASTVTPIDQQGLKWSHGLLGGNGAPTAIIGPDQAVWAKSQSGTQRSIANGDVDPVPFHRTTVIAPWATQQREWWLLDSFDAQQRAGRCRSSLDDHSVAKFHGSATLACSLLLSSSPALLVCRSGTKATLQVLTVGDAVWQPLLCGWWWATRW